MGFEGILLRLFLAHLLYIHSNNVQPEYCRLLYSQYRAAHLTLTSLLTTDVLSVFQLYRR